MSADTTSKPEVADEPAAVEPVAEEAEEKKEKSGKSITIALRMPGRGSLGRILVALVLIASVAATVWQWRHAEDLDERLRTRDQIGSVAGRFGQALLSYDHGDLAAARQRVLALATNDFGKTYEIAFAGDLQKAITDLKADATATVRVVYVSDAAGSTAQAVVVLDSKVNSTAGVRNVTGSYLQMNLVRENGSWKVSAVNSIGTVNESLTPDPSASASPSPSPSKSAP